MIIKVDTGSLQGTIQSIEAELTQIEQTRGNMMNSMMALQGTWEGEAHSTFETQYIQDDQFVTDLIRELNEFLEDLRVAKQNYEACDETVRAAIQALSI